MPTAIEKTNVLRKEFLELELNNDELLTMTQLYFYLDKKAKRQFDRDVGEQLHSRMNKGFSGKVSVDEFIKVFLQAEEILKNKIDQCKRCIVDYHKQRRDAATRFEEVKHSERVNQFGIMEGSILTVDLMNGVSFPQTNIQVMLQCDINKQEITSVNGPSPQWNQQYQFQISTGLEELQIYFITTQHPNTPKLLGTVTITLSRLSNQLKSSEWCTLYDKQGNITPFKVQLGLQWVFSEAKRLSQSVEQWNNNIKNLEDDLLDYERDLATLYEPFPSLIQLYRSSQPEIVKVQPLNYMVVTPISNTNESQYDILTISRILTLIIMTLATFICFGKTQFIDIILTSTYLIYYQSTLLNRQVLVYYVILNGITLIMDLIWASKYSRSYWGVIESLTDQYLSIENGPNRLALVLLYILFIIKFIYIIILGMASQQFEPVELPKQTNKNTILNHNKSQQFYSQPTAQFASNTLDKSNHYNY